MFWDTIPSLLTFSTCGGKKIQINFVRSNKMKWKVSILKIILIKLDSLFNLSGDQQVREVLLRYEVQNIDTKFCNWLGRSAGCPQFPYFSLHLAQSCSQSIVCIRPWMQDWFKLTILIWLTNSASTNNLSMRNN